MVLISFQLGAHINLTYPPNPAKVAKARDEINSVLEGFGSAENRIKILTVETPEMLRSRDERDLIASTWKTVEITRDYGDIGEEGDAPPDVKLERRTDLQEKLSNNVEGVDESGLKLGWFGFEERERAVRSARMEIQGALETVMPFAEDLGVGAGDDGDLGDYGSGPSGV
jgi:hypothetical protein